MTYKQLIHKEAESNEELDPLYTMAHLTVEECYSHAPYDAEWNDEATPDVLKYDI